MPASQDCAKTGRRGEPVQQAPKKKLACEECYRKKVKCSQEKPMCLKCRENGTYCTYLPSQRRGKGKAGPRPTRPNDQVPSNHPAGDPSYFENVVETFWPEPHGFLSEYGQDQLSEMGVMAFSAQDNVSMLSVSMQSNPASASSSMACSPHAGGQHVLSCGLDSESDARLYDAYRQLSHSQSTACGTAMTMSRTDSFQAICDVQQTYDLKLSPVSTPSSMGNTSPSFLATNCQQKQALPHPAITGGQPHGAHKSPAAMPRSQGGGRCECFNNCQQCLNALRQTNLSNDAKIMKLCGVATQTCLALLRCLICRNSISADTVSLLASNIDRVACLYSHVISRLDDEFAWSEAQQGRLDIAQQVQQEHMHQLFTQRVAALRDVHHMFIDICSRLPEGHAIAVAWVDRINKQMACIEGLFLASSEGMQGGISTDEDIPHFGPDFI